MMRYARVKIKKLVNGLNTKYKVFAKDLPLFKLKVSAMVMHALTRIAHENVEIKMLLSFV